MNDVRLLVLVFYYCSRCHLSKLEICRQKQGYSDGNSVSYVSEKFSKVWTFMKALVRFMIHGFIIYDNEYLVNTKISFRFWMLTL